MDGPLSHLVKLSPNAAVDLIMAGVSSWEATRAKRRSAVEIGGELWGYTKVTPSGLHVRYVEHVTVNAFGERKTGSHLADAHEEIAKRRVMGLLRPELSLLGDFHTHPYPDLPTLRRNNGWQRSPQDLEAWGHESSHWRSSGESPLFFVLALTRAKRIREADQEGHGHMVTFGVGEFRFWLSAYIGSRDAEGQPQFTPDNNSPVGLYLLPLELYSMKGACLEEFDPA